MILKLKSEFLIDNIFVSFGGTLFQQVVGIPMGTNCAPLLADLFLYSYESYIIFVITPTEIISGNWKRPGVYLFGSCAESAISSHVSRCTDKEGGFIHYIT
jgi:hypothetical protein